MPLNKLYRPLRRSGSLRVIDFGTNGKRVCGLSVS